MLHLIGLKPGDQDGIDNFFTLYQPEDICVFTDAGLLLASTLPLDGQAYLLEHPHIQVPTSHLETIDHSTLLDLVATHGPSTSWY
ncbi:MAG: hypothetical protein VX379_02120 [Pseudomonadota bacterium]|uniref:hypothetical protein n=1 Tax=Alcanivorax sp. TaxID=1872427 RepID=UPI0024378AD8|nr:hypothetical protein [Alcanivorax sp.]MED5238356.1 hypothetical protein [Pseudomonadota bacterium]MEE3320202.1 hypothetical protein [Pseudomonadota bacterium]